MKIREDKPAQIVNAGLPHGKWQVFSLSSR